MHARTAMAGSHMSKKLLWKVSFSFFKGQSYKIQDALKLNKMTYTVKWQVKYWNGLQNALEYLCKVKEKIIEVLLDWVQLY